MVVGAVGTACSGSGDAGVPGAATGDATRSGTPAGAATPSGGGATAGTAAGAGAGTGAEPHGDGAEAGGAAAAAETGAGTPAPAVGTAALRGGGSYFEVPDGDLRERLATQPLAEVKRGYGGRSVAFKIALADGTVGYYKPEQTFSAAHWWAEVAAYHLDRALGLGRVPPTVSRRLPWATLRASAPSDERFVEVIVGDDGTVRGSFSFWVPDRLVPMRFGRGWERWVRVQTWPDAAVSPFQRPRRYTELLAAQRQQGRARGAGAGEAAEGGDEAAGGEPSATAPSAPDRSGGDRSGVGTGSVGPGAADEPEAVTARDGNDRNDDGETLPRAPAEPDDAERAAELSDLVVFDYLTQNTDRWGGGNANVLTRGPGGRIVFLDNAAGFPDIGQVSVPLADARLRVLQRFRRRTVEALRALDVRAYARRMESEPLAPILTERMLTQLEQRRRIVLERVAEMQARFGDAALDL